MPIWLRTARATEVIVFWGECLIMLALVESRTTVLCMGFLMTFGMSTLFLGSIKLLSTFLALLLILRIFLAVQAMLVVVYTVTTVVITNGYNCIRTMDRTSVLLVKRKIRRRNKVNTLTNHVWAITMELLLPIPLHRQLAPYCTLGERSYDTTSLDVEYRCW